MTDVNDLLKRVLRTGEIYAGYAAVSSTNPVFKEAHAYLGSLEPVRECPNLDQCGGEQCYRLDALEARQERTEKVLHQLVQWIDNQRDPSLPGGTHTHTLRCLPRDRCLAITLLEIPGV